MNIYDFIVENAAGVEVSLKEYEGKVILIINSATDWRIIMEYIYKTQDTCSTEIKLNIDGNVVTNISFTGGCNGNLKTIPLLVDGWTVEEIEKKLSGMICGHRPNSCADRLAGACRAAYEEQKEETFAKKSYRDRLCSIKMI